MCLFSFFLYLTVPSFSPSPHLSLQPGSSTNCLQPPITRYKIIISGVLRSEESFNGSQTNATFTVPSCGASAVTVSAVNSAGTSVRSDPEIFSESVCVCVCLSVCECVWVCTGTCLIAIKFSLCATYVVGVVHLYLSATQCNVLFMQTTLCGFFTIITFCSFDL